MCVSKPADRPAPEVRFEPTDPDIILLPTDKVHQALASGLASATFAELLVKHPNFQEETQ